MWCPMVWWCGGGRSFQERAKKEGEALGKPGGPLLRHLECIRLGMLVVMTSCLSMVHEWKSRHDGDGEEVRHTAGQSQR